MITLATVVVLYLVTVVISIALLCQKAWRTFGEKGDFKSCFGFGFIWPVIVVVMILVSLEYLFDRFFGWIDELLVKFQDKVIAHYKKGD